MVTQHLKESLDRYHVGDKIKQLRLRRKMGLVELSRHTGLSPALLSKLEHGKLYPTLPTLSRIAMVFSMGLDFLQSGLGIPSAFLGIPSVRPGGSAAPRPFGPGASEASVDAVVDVDGRGCKGAKRGV